jgi:undecaprenyl diphosphate synthase
MDKKELISLGIDPSNIPRHIAIIMDGNGRWAKKKFFPRIAGHQAGVKSVDRIVTACREIGISALTLYSFSIENWKRPANEIEGLMKILYEYLKKELNRMLKEGIRFNTIGNIDDLPDFAQQIIMESKEKTKNNSEMVLTLALSYGGRAEIVNVAKRISVEVKEGSITPDDINESLFDNYLYTHDLPEVDLLIRTSGELRISNFLLWQIAYAELYFTDQLWPNYKEEDLYEAIRAFQARERRFGKTGDQLYVDRKVV